MIKIIEFIIFGVLMLLLLVIFICICHRIYEDWKEQKDIDKYIKEWTEKNK